MICKSCGAILPDNVKFCANCGAQQLSEAEYVKSQDRPQGRQQQQSQVSPQSNVFRQPQPNPLSVPLMQQIDSCSVMMIISLVLNMLLGLPYVNFLSLIPSFIMMIISCLKTFNVLDLIATSTADTQEAKRNRKKVRLVFINYITFWVVAILTLVFVVGWIGATELKGKYIDITVVF